MTDPQPIVERSPEAKRAYLAGYKQGMAWAIEGIRRGLPLETIEDAARTTVQVLEDSFND